VGQGEYEPWFNILKGKTHQLHYGYYATRWAAPKEMEQTWSESRKKEENFFNSKDPWCHVDKNRVGIEKLTEALSVRLSQMIEEMFDPRHPLANTSLPTLKKDLFDKMKKVQSELGDLPQSFADNPQRNLLSLCSSFVQEIDKYTNGQPIHPPNQPTFLRDALRHYRGLEKEIKRTRPQFNVVPDDSQDSFSSDGESADGTPFMSQH
jgi:hypothetical protein